MEAIGDETATSSSAKIDDKIMNLEYLEERLKTEFPYISEVVIKLALRFENPENLESIRRQLRRIETLHGRGEVTKKRPSPGKAEEPIVGTLGECGGDLVGRHFSDQKRTDDAFEEGCSSTFADDEFRAQHPGQPGNSFGYPPPTKHKPSQEPIRNAQQICTKDQREYKGCPSEGGAHEDNHQGGDKSGILQQKQAEDDCQPELTQKQGQQIHNNKKGLRGAFNSFKKKMKNALMPRKLNVKSDGDAGQREVDVHISSETFATGSETERGYDLGDKGREQSMSSVGENQSLCIEKGERFEENKLVVSELRGPTTNEGVLCHTEAMSGHIRTLGGQEVKEESVMGKEKVLDTMDEPVTTLQVVMNVDPDIMEYVTSTSHHDELKEALSVKKSEIKWTPRNKTAVVVFRGEDETNSWQSECIDLVQSYLRKFAKHDAEVKKEFWEAVKTRLFDVRACLGINPPLIKSLDESFRARIVCMSSEAKAFEDQVKAKLEEIYREETRKTYLKFSKRIPKERIILLKKIKFAEKLQQQNKELEITLDTEAEKICFEGPQEQYKEADMKC